MYSQTTLIGRLGQDPKLATAGNTPVLTFSVATSEYYKKDGQNKEITTWHTIKVWGKLAEILSDKLAKGDLVLVVGIERTDKGKDRHGNEVTYHSIRADRVTRLNKRETQRTDAPPAQGGFPGSGGEDPFAEPGDEDIPF